MLPGFIENTKLPGNKTIVTDVLVAEQPIRDQPTPSPAQLDKFADYHKYLIKYYASKLPSCCLCLVSKWYNPHRKIANLHQADRQLYVGLMPFGAVLEAKQSEANFPLYIRCST